MSETPLNTEAANREPTGAPDIHVNEPYNGEVVISGISGRFPESDNIQEFRDNLMNGIDMITEDDRRWTPGIWGLPKRHGKLKDLSKFDADFFGVHPKHASFMDPQLRNLLELTYEAIVDAGVNPEDIRGSRTGVFVGTQSADSGSVMTRGEDWDTGYILTGTAVSMFANRLSYFFDFKGPSVPMDTACSASMIAFNQALASIRSGDCDAAIVAGSNLCLQPITSLHFMKLGMLSPEGMCKSFDESGNGYCRSEAIVVLYLQKKPCAKRIYCTVMHSKTNTDGYKPEGVTFPSSDMQKRLLRETYKEAGVSPLDVAYVEAHGTGTVAGDSQEGNAICDVFCQDRESPLLIGSIKTNMGHPESPSGVCAVAKMVIAMEENVIPATLHYKSPNPEIPGLVDGKMKVVSENTPWEGGIIGLNSFGFGGANVHAILKSHEKVKLQRNDRDKTRLFVYGSRTQEGLEDVLNLAQKHHDDMELHGLLNETANLPINTHPHRGYTLLNGNDAIRNVKKATILEKRPVWYVLSGMGSQWPAMGREMMEIEVFRNSILESDAILKPLGITLYENLMSDGKQFDRVVNSITGIISVQVALMDTLSTLGIKPDGIIGHSVGEISCAYADGCLSAREAVLAAYWRGHCIEVASLPKGAMAAVGLTWQETIDQCPQGVVPACHNAEDSVTISGKEEAVKQFVDTLQQKGVFAKMVDSAGVAFHSHFMQSVAPALKQALEKTITSKERTERWISTSFPESEWSTEAAKFSSADYHVKNLVSPVLFEEGLKHVPNNAIVIEIAPHGLLQAILKRSLNKECSTEALMKKGHPHNNEFFLAGLGKCYQAGLSVDPLKLFEPVEFPVARGTPMISPQIKWDHSHTWKVPKVSRSQQDVQRGTTFEIDLSKDSDDRFLIDHKLDGRIVFPGAGYLVLAWKAIANREGKKFEEVPIKLEDVTIHRATMMSTEKKNYIEVNLIPGTDDFQILDGMDLVADGKITIPDKKELSKIVNKDEGADQPNGFKGDLVTEDLYKEFRLLGFEFGPSFRSIIGATFDFTKAILRWTGNWITFIDGLAQMGIHGKKSMGLPTHLTSILIDPELHMQKILDLEEDSKGVKVFNSIETKESLAGGVLVGSVSTIVARRTDKKHPVMEMHKFVPFSVSVQPESEPELKEYINKCSRLSIETINNLIENGVSNGFKSFLDDRLMNETFVKQTEDKQETVADDAQHSLIGLLTELSKLEYNEAFMEKAAECIKAKMEDIQSDCSVGNLLQPHYLKPCLDIVGENCHTRNLKVVELGDKHLTSAVFRLVNSHPALNIAYSVATSNVEAFEDIPEKKLLHEVINWKLNDEKSKQLPKAHLFVANNILRKQENIQNTLSAISESLESGGFVLVNEVTRNFHISAPLDELYTYPDGPVFDDLNTRTCGMYSNSETWKNHFKMAGFEIICDVTDNLLNSMFLLRKIASSAVDDQTFIKIDNSCDWVEDLKTKLAQVILKPKGSNLWLTTDNSLCGMLGLVNCLRFEEGGDRIRCIFNMDKPVEEIDDAQKTSIIKRDLVMNVYQQGEWGTYRHLALKQVTTVPSEHAYIVSATRGDLSSLKWHESRLKYYNGTDKSNRTLCDIHYASLNFRDIMLATGKLSQDAIPGGPEYQECMLGMEFSGTDQSGRRVMGMLPAKGLATVVDAPNDTLLPVPDDWSLEDAATVPVVYCTAVYALIARGNIRRGDSVLIHSGSGGVGQAAISIALHYGCKVYTTVGTNEKREYIKERFPQVTDNDIFNSRDTTFEQELLRATGGRGVDIVLNSLAGDKLQSSVRVLAKNGRFLEIGKFDLFKNTPLGMSVFLKNISFHGILLDALFEDGNIEFQGIYRILEEGLKAGFVKPLQATVFDKTDVEKAFRYMASGKHMGKVLVKIRDECGPITVPAIPRAYCHPEKAYIITGGLGGFGLELAQWLAERGAKCLVLTSRSGIKTGYQKIKIRNLRQEGVDVIVSKRNICNKQETEQLVQETNGRAVGGIFHLAMVLKDGMFQNQTVENFQSVCDTKVRGTNNLDHVTRETCKSTLDWFVVFSSITSGRGNAGQTNYGLANSTMERICEQRRRDGHHGLAIQWGPIGDVGVFMDTIGDNDSVLGGTMPQRISSCMNTLDIFLNQANPVVSSYVPVEKSNGGKDDGTTVLQKIMNIIGVTEEDQLDPDKPLTDLGLDSLLGVEVKLALENDYNLSLSPKEIRELTINKLQKLVDDKAKSEGFMFDAEDEVQLDFRYFLTQDTLAEVIPLKKIVKLNDVTEGTPLFIMHHMFGHADIMGQVAAHVDVPVYGIQRTADLYEHGTSMSEMALCYIQGIEEFCPDQEFHLAGYSFGAVMAQEMALQLQERNDNIKSLILLDASKKWTDIIMDRVQKDDDHIEIKAMRTLLEFCAMTVVDNKLIWSEEVGRKTGEAMIRLNPELKYEELKEASKFIYDVTMLLPEFQFSGKYHGNVRLIAADTSLNVLNIDPQYGLSDYCDGEVTVHVVKGRHVSFIQGESAIQVAKIINEVIRTSSSS